MMFLYYQKLILIQDYRNFVEQNHLLTTDSLFSINVLAIISNVSTFIASNKKKLVMILFWIVWIVTATVIAKTSKSTTVSNRICAFGDFNHDKYTDILVHQLSSVTNQQQLFFRLQNDNGNGKFYDSNEQYRINLTVGVGVVVRCAIGDFDGNARVDVVVTEMNIGGEYSSTIYYFDTNVDRFVRSNQTISAIFDEPMIVDVNADGISDLLYFQADQLFACLGVRHGMELSCNKEPFVADSITPWPRFNHAFADLDGDLMPELLFGVKRDERLDFQVWKQTSANNWTQINIIGRIDDNGKSSSLNDPAKGYGLPAIGDVNANGRTNIVVPICTNVQCTRIDRFAIWELNVGWHSVVVENRDNYTLVTNADDGALLLRMGDFDLDGYPDLVAIAIIAGGDNKPIPVIFSNVACDDCGSVQRKFSLNTGPHFIETSHMAMGTVAMATFFDRKEDGNLELLVEYEFPEKSNMINYDFIELNERGDTTFLRIEVFTNICFQDCNWTRDANDIGSAISWHGATLYYTMSDTSGGQQHGIHTQLSQTAHRSLQLPFALFGLGRSPNFVDVVRVGAPVWNANVDAPNRMHEWKQIVPNSRIYVVPPGPSNHQWISRLYMTPSRLILQSCIALAFVCFVLLAIIGVLHWKERRVDRVERQAQSHRFHFDAM